MFHILVPTNFSTASQNAIRYALTLSEKVKGKITLLHSFSTHDSTYDTIIESLQQEHRQKLAHLAGSTIAQSDVLIETESYEGDLATAISKTFPELIVMGIEGETPFERLLVGRDLKKVIDKMPCPILFIPEEAKWSEISKIVYATDYHSDDTDNLRYLVKLTKSFDPEISMVHISDGAYTDQEEEYFLSLFKKEIHTHIHYKKINYQLLYGKDVNERLELLIHEEHPSMVAMITEKRFMFDRLFHSSATKKMAFHTHIPLLVFSNIYW